MARRQQNFYFKLKDQAEDGKGEELHGHACIGVSGMLEIFIEGYGEHGAADGEGSCLQVEIWEGKLRVLARQDINAADPVVLDMEMAQEKFRREIPE